MLYLKRGFIMEQESENKPIKAKHYSNYNKKLGFTRYRFFYWILQRIFLELNPPIPKDIDFREGEVCFQYKKFTVAISSKLPSYCEYTGTGWFNINDRIEIHKMILRTIIKYKNK